MHENEHAHDIIALLKSYEKRLHEMIDMIRDKQSLTTSERDWLRRTYAAFKTDVRKAVKRGTIDPQRRQPTRLEAVYFVPTMCACSTGLIAATNSHPLNVKWDISLRSALSSINSALFQLELQFPPFDKPSGAEE